MQTTAEDFQNVIRLVTCTHDPLCHGYRWHIENEDTLAHLVAWTMLGHYQHAERILTSLSVTPIANRPTSQQQAIARLTLPDGTPLNATIRYHRDGQVFQHIAWLAAIIEAGNNVATMMPHMRPADKGFDSLLIPLSENRSANSGLFICEEKATGSPRNEITNKIWPSIKSIEEGKRDAELTGHLMAILREHQVRNIDEIAADIHWLNHKAYRISITISPQQDTESIRKSLFSGFDTKAPGDIARRRAETVALPDLRNWMDAFTARVIAWIQGE